MLASAGAAVAAGLVLLASQTLGWQAIAPPASDCERVLAAFHRTGKWAVELAAVLEHLESETASAAIGRLQNVREGLEHEARLLQSPPLSPAFAEAQSRSLATVAVLRDLADPNVVMLMNEDREAFGGHVRDQFLAARSEARAARDALKQEDPACTAARTAQSGGLHLLRRSGQ
jgi:hypothetical protein